ncbi:MAG TPA: hypothetical protein DCZ72_09735 [Armatimonadetes bacterium]|nr:hypothetical protein [Armatimonadota bacterium]
MPTTIPGLLREAADKFASLPVLHSRGADGNLAPVTYDELRVLVDRVAAGLVAAGVQPGERVVLVSENRDEWLVADLAIQTAGAISVPLYPSLPAAQVRPLIQRVSARLVIVEDAKQLAKIDAIRAELPLVETIVVIEDGDAPADRKDVIAWAALRTSGDQHLVEVEERYAGVQPDDVATIIFTSGTTGEPKGVMLTQSNLYLNVAAAQKRITLLPGDRMVVLLPLSHAFQRIVTYLALMAACGQYYNRTLRRLMADLHEVRPTIWIIVPRMADLMKQRVVGNVAESPGLKGKIARWALNLAPAIGAAQNNGGQLGGLLKLQQGIAEALVYSKIREQLGLDQLRFAVSGGAALAIATSRWFHGIGVNLVQGYGLTENTPVVSCNPESGPVRYETIGPPVDGCEVRRSETGELLVRGPYVMAGYLDNPEATAEVIDEDGWLHTGDLVEIDPDGHIRIIGRSREIMVLASGKNVAPVAVEEQMEAQPLISRAVVFADGQNVVSALIVPEYEPLWAAVQAAAPSAERDAAGAWLESPAVRQVLDAEIAAANANLASYERVMRYTVLPRDFSLENEELTPTMKIRRTIIAEHFAAEVAAMAGVTAKQG